MPLATDFKNLLFSIGGYPFKEFRSDYNDIQFGHKVSRNLIRVVLSVPAIILGSLLPYKIATDLGSHLDNISKAIVSALFGESAQSSATLISFLTLWISIWGLWSATLFTSKHLLRLYNYFKKGDTNSDHFLSEKEKAELVNTYVEILEAEDHKPVDKKELAEKIDQTFSYIIKKIRVCKKIEENSIYSEDFKELHDKKYYKRMLISFRNGNSEPYDNHCDFDRHLINHRIERINKSKLLCDASMQTDFKDSIDLNTIKLDNKECITIHVDIKPKDKNRISPPMLNQLRRLVGQFKKGSPKEQVTPPSPEELEDLTQKLKAEEIRMKKVLEILPEKITEGKKSPKKDLKI